MPSAPPRILLIHGFTQTGVSWRPVIELLKPLVAAGTEIVAVDAPGHGDAADVRADLAGASDLLADHIGRSGGPARIMGYSMGGRLALRLALDHPEAVASLVLLGATAGIDDPMVRRSRRDADEALAARIETDGVDAFLEGWLAQPIFAGLDPQADDLAARRANTASGLASSLRLAGTATMDPPWWGDLHRITCPTLILWGERDPKFAVLGRRLAEAIGPNATTEPIADAGHAAHLEAPAAVALTLANHANPPI